MRTSFKFLIIMLLLLAFGALILSSEFFSIKDIYVLGNNKVLKSNIISSSKIQYGQNIFRINKKSIMRGIFEDPRIKGVRVKRTLPSSIYLDVIEREVVALIPYLGSFLNIDDEAVITEITDIEGQREAPIVEGLEFNDFKIGEALEIENLEGLDVALKVVSALQHSKLHEETISVNIEDLDSIVITTRTGIRIYICDNKIDYRIQMAKEIVEDLLKSNEMGIIDMRHDGNPIFKRD